MSISFSIDLFGAKKPVEGQFLLSGKAVRPPPSSLQRRHGKNTSRNLSPRRQEFVQVIFVLKLVFASTTIDGSLLYEKVFELSIQFW